MSILEVFYRAREYFSKVWRYKEYPTALLEVFAGGAKLTIPGKNKPIARTYLPLKGELDYYIEIETSIEWAIDSLLRGRIQELNLEITGGTYGLFYNCLERSFLE